MPETFALAAPTGPQTPEYRIHTLTLERGLDFSGPFIESKPEQSFIEVILVGQNGLHKRHRWSGVDADAMIVALNKASLTTNTLTKRIFARLVQDGVLAGTVEGATD